MTQFIDLSHTIEQGMETYRGLPGPSVSDYVSRDASQSHYGPDVTFQIGKIEMVANTGTYLDVPFHRYEDGFDLAGLKLERVVSLPGQLIPLQEGSRAMDADAFAGLDLKGKAVLLHTGWDRHWRTDSYFEKTPYLTKRGAEALVDAGAALVGIDALNVDNTDDPARPAHSILLDAGILIVEHLCRLDLLPERGFLFSAVPIKVKGMGSFPVRAYAQV